MSCREARLPAEQAPTAINLPMPHVTGITIGRAVRVVVWQKRDNWKLVGQPGRLNAAALNSVSISLLVCCVA